MATRTLVIGDIHGAHKALTQVMERAQVTTNDKLIFLGDYVDGWSESPGVIDLLIELRSSHDCVFIKGNHDDLFLQWIENGFQNELWLLHGGQSTLDAYKEVSETRLALHADFLRDLSTHYHDEENRLFVHAGFTNLNGVYKEYFSDMLYWDRSLWEMALALDPTLSPEDPFYPDRLKLYREIYIGHTPTTRIGKSVPVNKASVWNLDTGAAYKSPLTIMDVDTKTFWQSDNVNELYPNEKGRNK